MAYQLIIRRSTSIVNIFRLTVILVYIGGCCYVDNIINGNNRGAHDMARVHAQAEHPPQPAAAPLQLLHVSPAKSAAGRPLRGYPNIGTVADRRTYQTPIYR